MEIPADAPRPRLCHIVKRDNFNGYGFNLHAEKSKPGQFIGTVDPGSPCADAGLKEGDRILEVNGVNISLENHKQVVMRIKAIPNETRLLVVDQETENYYRRKDVVVRGDMPNVLEISSKETVVANHHQNNSDADDIKEDEDAADKVVHETVYSQEDNDAKDDQGNEITSSPSLRKEHDNGSVVDNAERDEGLLGQGVDEKAGNCKIQILVTADIETSSSEADNGVATNQAKVEPDLPVPEETIEVPWLAEGEQREPGGEGQKNEESIDDGRSLSSEEDGQQDKFKHEEAAEAAEAAAAPVAPVAAATAVTTAAGQSTTAFPPVNDSVQANASGNAVNTDAKTENSTSASEQTALERAAELPSSKSPPNLKREVAGKTVETDEKDQRWGGLNLNMTAKEMRQRIGSRKKMDPRKSSEPRLDFQKKYDIIQTL